MSVDGFSPVFTGLSLRAVSRFKYVFTDVLCPRICRPRLSGAYPSRQDPPFVLCVSCSTTSSSGTQSLMSQLLAGSESGTRRSASGEGQLGLSKQISN